MTEDKRLETVQTALKAYPDFPKPGILFQDIFAVFSSPTALEAKFYSKAKILFDMFQLHVYLFNYVNYLLQLGLQRVVI